MELVCQGIGTRQPFSNADQLSDLLECHELQVALTLHLDKYMHHLATPTSIARQHGLFEFPAKYPISLGRLVVAKSYLENDVYWEGRAVPVRVTYEVRETEDE